MRNLLSLASILVAAGCTSYAPDLGPSPFKCGDAEPRCPDGYTCDEAAMGGPACVKEGTDAPQIDASTDTFQCANENGIEPNDTKDSAFVTPVAGTRMDFTLGPVGICTDGDKDYYKVDVPANTNLEVISSWESGQPVGVSINSSADVPLINATMRDAMSMRACAAGLQAGSYYARTSAAAGVRNNYRLSIKIVSSCN